MRKLLLILIFISASASAKQDIDYLNLGAVLLKDGFIERAKNVLDKVEIDDPGFDYARFYTLKGILLNQLNYPSLSNIFLDAAIVRGQDNPSIQLYVAKNHWLLHNYAEVIEALDKAGKAARENEQLMVMKAEAYKLQGLYEESWAVLDEGIALFPASSVFYRQKFYYLLELGFYQHAGEYAKKYLASGDGSAKDYLAVAYTFRENQQLESAARLLEQAAIRYPDDDKIIELLGQVYIDQEHYIPAASVFGWSSIEHPKFAYKAASLYLKADDPVRSLQLNRRISKQDDKFRQRLGIDIYLDDYVSLVAKIPSLKRYDLLKDDNIMYAVGYGYFRNGDFINSKKYLQKITDSQLFSKASTIFLQIEKCQDEPLDCY